MNSCTDYGLQFIAQYNGFSEEWESEKMLFNDSMSLAQKRFILFKLYVKHHNKRRYHLDQMEGGHCKVANVQANFCSPLDPQHGYLSKLTSYTLKHFTQVGLIPRKGIKDSHIIGAYSIVIKEGVDWEGFFCDTSTVGVRYLKTLDIARPTYLDVCCMVSKAIGSKKNKILLPRIPLSDWQAMYPNL